MSVIFTSLLILMLDRLNSTYIDLFVNTNNVRTEKTKLQKKHSPHQLLRFTILPI